MGGLLLKDWYLTLRYCRAIFLMEVVFLAASAIGGASTLIAAYPCLMAGLLPITLYIYDEREKWLENCAAMPLSRRTYVSAKYLYGLFCALSVVVLSAAFNVAAMLLLPGRGGAFLPDLPGFMALTLIAPAIVLPLMLKFGAEKGRILYYVIIGFICAASIVFTDAEGGALPAFFSFRTGGAALLLGAAALYAASWALSVALFQRREL